MWLESDICLLASMLVIVMSGHAGAACLTLLDFLNRIHFPRMPAKVSKRTLFLCVLSTFFAPAFGQQMYRCGNTFSQHPCGPDATTIRSQGVLQPSVPDGPLDGEKVARMKLLCREMLIRVPDWKDRESLRIGEVYRGKAEVRTIDGSPQIVRVYLTRINGKNSYGAYTGEKAAACYANEHETRIVDIFTPS